MRNFKTREEAVHELKRQGYDTEYQVKSGTIQQRDLGQNLAPDEFKVREIFHFEHENDDDIDGNVYAIETTGGRKGILIDVTHAEEENITEELRVKLSLHNN